MKIQVSKSGLFAIQGTHEKGGTYEYIPAYNTMFTTIEEAREAAKASLHFGYYLVRILKEEEFLMKDVAV